MPSKPRTLAGILRPRHHADRAYNRDQRDSATAAVHGSARWQAVRLQVLRDEPLCRACAGRGVTELATQVDHVIPLDVAPERAFDRANLQPLCSSCHAWKSTAERQGEGGTSNSRGERPPSGARGTPLFSRVSPPATLPPAQGQNQPPEGQSEPLGGTTGTPASGGALRPSEGQYSACGANQGAQGPAARPVPKAYTFDSGRPPAPSPQAAARRGGR